MSDYLTGTDCADVIYGFGDDATVTQPGSDSTPPSALLIRSGGLLHSAAGLEDPRPAKLI